jgi:hypothetical protein
MVSLKGSINEINVEKVFADGIATSATTASLDLSLTPMPLTDQSGAVDPTVCRASGIVQPLLVLQSAQAFFYGFAQVAGLTLLKSSTTAGDFVGIYVPAGEQEYVRPAAQNKRHFLYTLRDTADSTVNVFVTKTSGF